MVDYSRLIQNWTRWSALMGLADVYAAENYEGAQVFFHSNDNALYLRNDGEWWSIDSVNERGKRLNDIAAFSSYSLAEKFLIWRWSAVARSSVGARQLGAELQAQGRMEGVTFTPASRPYFVELSTDEGRAIVAEANSVVFSHVMCMSVDDIEALVSRDL